MNFDDRPESWSTMSVHGFGEERETRSYQSVQKAMMVGVRTMGSLGTWGKVEANPARLVDPGGWEAVGLDSLGDAVQVMISHAEDWMELAVPPEQARVKRLDICRDFETEHPAQIIRGLGPVHRPWARRNLVHFDPSRSGAQTLMVGSASGVVRCYDKHAETQGRAPVGTVRWEVEARSEWCKRYGHIETVGDIDSLRLESLAMDRWNWSAMGREISGTDVLIEKVMRLDVSPTVKRGLLGHLMLEQAGCGYPLGKETAARYRKLCREMGVTLDPEAEPGLSMRLDWWAGTEQVKAGL